ncbi:YybH family protein [Haloferula chungangensis]|uniref:YybH family protein n=1 Tax=Haloferula chungangensis TaxID=1048331 RepID=A0ABW2L538_9BACT
MSAALVLVLAFTPGLKSEETTSEIGGLKKAAETFVAAYNKKDAKSIAELFTENGEILDRDAHEVTSGRAEIQARYEALFALPDAPQIALEVDSVRFVGKDLAIEDGTVHATAPGDDSVATSMSYTAVLQKSEDGFWRIASSRDRSDTSDSAGRLGSLARQIKGDWTATRDGVRLDLAFGWDDSGNYLIGEMLVTAADAKPLKTTLRIAWDPANETITWWAFDDGGGFSRGDWTPVGETDWLIRTEGTTADGEITSANQTLAFEGKDRFLWNSSARLIDGVKQEDLKLRVVRQTPEPGIE